MLSRRSGDRCAPVWLWNRSIRPKEIVLHYGRGLSHWNGAVGVFMESCELRLLSGADRRWNWRRIRRDQLGNRRAYSGAGAWSRRLDDQRFLLGWRGSWFRRNCHFARAGSISNLVRLAFCVWDWCDTRPSRDFLSPVDPGKPALVDDSRT